MAKVTLDLGAIDAMSDRAAEGGLRQALGEYERILKTDVLNRAGTGKQYGKHQASAPGEPPARDLGNLVANTNADPNIREDGNDVVGQVVANSEYARPLHEGTERIAARPFMDLPAKENQRELTEAFIAGAKS
ncbi:hypothetical protein QOZ96_003598 [Brevundimonas nasdae]|uniref:hypothetical protein n=1 Tax=Brevundimonas nasdae TaxID=172043 RepID=UPI0019123BAF|nr:hypothetical protein [Brevundimonas nasdae]MBK6024538.1 hypothetical protein [Brevundimonas nasdae]MDQ0453625.1 hypothetical protein [Brevundimonas nasdae]